MRVGLLRHASVLDFVIRTLAQKRRIILQTVILIILCTPPRAGMQHNTGRPVGARSRQSCPRPHPIRGGSHRLPLLPPAVQKELQELSAIRLVSGNTLGPALISNALADRLEADRLGAQKTSLGGNVPTTGNSAGAATTGGASRQPHSHHGHVQKYYPPPPPLPPQQQQQQPGGVLTGVFETFEERTTGLLLHLVRLLPPTELRLMDSQWRQDRAPWGGARPTRTITGLACRPSFCPHCCQRPSRCRCP